MCSNHVNNDAWLSRYCPGSMQARKCFDEIQAELNGDSEGAAAQGAAAAPEEEGDDDGEGNLDDSYSSLGSDD